METINEVRPRVRMDELGLYLKTIELDYCPKNNKERAELITEFFPVLCLEEDVDKYERLSIEPQEDWELESRRHSFFQSLGRGDYF